MSAYKGQLLFSCSVQYFTISLVRFICINLIIVLISNTHTLHAAFPHGYSQTTEFPYSLHLCGHFCDEHTLL